MLTRELLGYDELLYEALKRRARRNYRTVRQEIRAILAEALAEEADALRAERAAEQPDVPKQGARL
jgi:plasmid stability protein